MCNRFGVLCCRNGFVVGLPLTLWAGYTVDVVNCEIYIFSFTCPLFIRFCNLGIFCENNRLRILLLILHVLVAGENAKIKGTE